MVPTKPDIVLIENGPRAGEYLISAETVDRLPEFYESVRKLPYKSGPANQLADVYRTITSDRTSTIYQAYSTAPVGLELIVPLRWMLNLPGWAKADIAGIAVWQWLGRGFSFLVSLLFVFGVYRLARRLARRRQDDSGPGWHSLLTPLAIILLAGLVGPLLDKIFRISGSPLVVIAYAQTIALFLSAAWLAMVGASVLGETIVTSDHLRPHSLDSQLIRLGMRFVGIVVAIGLLIWAGDELGFPAYSILAGLGVGGLAIALAIRPTPENIIGGLILLADRPVLVGEFCRYGSEIGTVEDIGLRSTRIRTLGNSLASVPNSEFSQMHLDNYSRRKIRLLKTVLQLRYETTPEQIRYVLAKLRELLLAHPMVTPDPARVRFVGYGACSKDVEVFAYLRCQAQDAFLAIQEDILLRMEEL